ncbi:hypothetical protein CRENPOLYSF1_70013 [Crenothrix polyspora]|uniref:Uncharacterized protein n=1 Tax=Crenothrix polyspora TaxID=360316 RepID=A0A1R4HHU1_9GAMM|nr:hypothetical protein CRENPOLYSF1_70013 [Crenothrix polyspora]
MIFQVFENIWDFFPIFKVFAGQAFHYDFKEYQYFFIH